MKNILITILLFIPCLAFSQKTSLGIKAGIVAFKPAINSSHVIHPLSGIVFRYSPKKVGIGIEPGLTFKKEYYYTKTDNNGLKIDQPKSKPYLELPIYLYFKAIDNGFKLNIEGGYSFYGKSISMFAGFYAGFKSKNTLIGLNYRINGMFVSPFTDAYHTPFVSIQYQF